MKKNAPAQYHRNDEIERVFSIYHKNIFMSVALLLLQILHLASASASAVEVTLAWNRNSEPDVVGYQLHFGTASGRYNSTLDVGDTAKVTVSNLAPGYTYYFVVTAYNDAGLESLASNEASFAASANPTLRLTMTSPVDGAEFSAPANVTLSATADDSSLTRIGFYNGEVKLGEDSTSPYAFSWSGIPSGEYTLTARAVDSTGATVTSAPIRITVVTPATTLNAMQRLSNGGFEFRVSGEPNRTNHIWASRDLKNWTLLDSVVNTTGTFVISDPGAVGEDRRFYKVTVE